MKQVSLVALALALLAGCGTAAGSASPSVASIPPSVAPVTASPPPSLAPSAAASGPTGSATTDLLHDDTDLEARLPKEVNGTRLFVFSIGPISAAGNPGADPIKKLARELGDGSGNFSLAFANDPTAPTFNLFALRVHGAAPGPLVERYGALTEADTAGSVSEQVTIEGRPVVHVTAPGNPIGGVWIYATGDTLFGVQAGSADQATALLALLP